MKSLKIGELEIKICEHAGDINYLRYVRFKQWVIQIWERMDVPVFKMHFDKFNDLFNQGKYNQGSFVWYDYKIAIEQKDLDAWGVCFALLTVDTGEDANSIIDDSEIKKKIQNYSKHGLTAKTVKEEVVNFMKASPEEFGALMIAQGVPFLMQTIENTNIS
jgi:hypothetical protein